MFSAHRTRTAYIRTLLEREHCFPPANNENGRGMFVRVEQATHYDNTMHTSTGTQPQRQTRGTGHTQQLQQQQNDNNDDSII